ncbi:MAG: DUF3124 domain-containing protein [Polyangiales bacterium]
MTLRSSFHRSLILCLVLCGCGEEPVVTESEVESPEPPAQAAPRGEARLRTVYVPAYSNLPNQGTGSPHLVAILLSLRNVDSRASITLTHVEYFDTSGHRVRRYLSAPRELRPLETAEFTVAATDDAGGSGANFLVYWEGPADAHSLLAEAVMTTQIGAGYVGFTSRGVELEHRPDPAMFEGEAPPPNEEPAP